MLIITPKEKPVKFLFTLSKKCSNNKAKYKALISELEIVLDQGVRDDETYRGSYLVIK